jgi:hypothetical protein
VNVKKKRCSFEGCTTVVINGGVCITHGAIKKKRCSFKGCTNGAVKGGVCVTHGATRKGCSFEGCTSNARGKEGVCYRHREKSGINTNNNSTLVSNADVTPPIPPYQSIDYEEEEELNSWIWKSCRIPKNYASKKCN